MTQNEEAMTTTATAVPSFPADAISHVLRDELIAAVRAEARRKGQALPENDNEIVATAVEIDSLTAVELLCALDDVLPFQVTECVVRAGGYKSIDLALKHLVVGIEKKWKEHHIGGKK
jgi:hypothetical protein